MAFWLDAFDPEVFDTLGKGLQAIIEQSPEYKAAVSADVRQPEPAMAGDDDIPF
jgi:hypothetical protein